jgi:hypothetical protein
MIVIKTPLTSRRNSARMGGGISGGLVRTSGEKREEFATFCLESFIFKWLLNRRGVSV